MKILVIEDDVTLCNMIADDLIDKGHKVMLSYDGADALKLLEKECFDCVLTDIYMPNADGYEVINAITRSTIGTKIIAISGMQDRVGYDCLTMASQLGADMTIAKPFNLSQIHQCLANFSQA